MMMLALLLIFCEAWALARVAGWVWVGALPGWVHLLSSLLVFYAPLWVRLSPDQFLCC